MDVAAAVAAVDVAAAVAAVADADADDIEAQAADAAAAAAAYHLGVEGNDAALLVHGRDARLSPGDLQVKERFRSRNGYFDFAAFSRGRTF